MGKSTAGAMLEFLGVPIHESDKAVHEYLNFDSEAWTAIAAAFPYFSYPQIYKRKHYFNPFKKTERSLDRGALGKVIFENDEKREELESILHPFVQQSQARFIKAQQTKGQDIVALDIPLLFETGAEKRVDLVVNISAPAFIQHARVLARPNMNEGKLAAILKRQMPDGEKCVRADYVVHSGLGRGVMMKELKHILAEIRKSNTVSKANNEKLRKKVKR